MIIGVLQFELLMRGNESLKDKRRIVKSLKDRLHRSHMVSVAEIGALDERNVALLDGHVEMIPNEVIYTQRYTETNTLKLRWD